MAEFKEDWTFTVSSYDMSYKKATRLFDMIATISHYFHKDITVGMCPMEDEDSD